jgi:uncharacterized LabA/DUF88 family protein
MEDTLIFVDNGFFKLVKEYFEKTSGKKKRLLQTFRNICKKENLNLEHLFFYFAPPFQSRIPTDKENSMKGRYDKIKKMIEQKQWATMREGRCQKIYNEFGEVKFNQKGVDSWIIADLCLFKKKFPQINKVILISSDSDFAPIIEMIKKEMNIEVILYTYFEKSRKSIFRCSNHLLKSCSKWVKLNERDFENFEK